MTVQQAFALAADRYREGKPAEAKDLLEQILIHDPQHAYALHLLGIIVRDEGDKGRGLELVRRVIEVSPQWSAAHCTLGDTLLSMGQTDDAIASYRRVLEIDPNNAAVWCSLGAALALQKRYSEAIDAFERFVVLKPDSAEGHYNIGRAYDDQGDIERAALAYRRAVEQHPRFALAWNNLGNKLRHLGQFSQAIDAFRGAIAADSSYAYAHLNMALTLLLVGQNEEGLKEFEWRWLIGDAMADPSAFSRPRWDGSPLNGRRLLVHAEQGLGDTVHFIRYLPLLTPLLGSRGEHAREQVIVEVQPFLLRLIEPYVRKLGERFSLIGRGQRRPAFDVHCPLLSLPHTCKFSISGPPADVPYLQPHAEDVEHWRRRLAEIGASLKVGLVWGGNPAHLGDARRSIALSALAPLAAVPGVQFVSLQVGPPARQAAASAMPLINWSHEFRGFNDAGLMAQLDLIITVDTSVAHIAGAMAVPTWLLLCSAPDWRWGIAGETTRWYPTVRLFRQRRRDDWSDVMAAVTDALRARAG
jgi:tetratricopeptide (TPR) repeat protein